MSARGTDERVPPNARVASARTAACLQDDGGGGGTRREKKGGVLFILSFSSDDLTVRKNRAFLSRRHGLRYVFLCVRARPSIVMLMLIFDQGSTICPFC